MSLGLAVSDGFASFLVGSSFSVFAVKLRDAKELENTAENRALKKRVTALANRLELSKPVEIRFSEKGGFGQASGNTLLPGRAGFIVGNQFLKLSPAAQEFIILHELAHLKNNDHLKGSALMGLSIAVTTYAIPILTTSIIAISFAPTVLGIIAFLAFSNYFEKRADITAISLCSPQGKKGGIALFERMRINYLEAKNDPHANFFKKLLITDKGDFRLDLYHPSLSERVKYLRELSQVKSKAAMRAKGSHLQHCRA